MKCVADAILVGLNVKNMSQKELAKAVGVSEGTISHYVYGRMNPRLTEFVKICRVLRLSPNKMFKLIEEEINNAK